MTAVKKIRNPQSPFFILYVCTEFFFFFFYKPWYCVFSIVGVTSLFCYQTNCEIKKNPRTHALLRQTRFISFTNYFCVVFELNGRNVFIPVRSSVWFWHDRCRQCGYRSRNETCWLAKRFFRHTRLCLITPAVFKLWGAASWESKTRLTVNCISINIFDANCSPGVFWNIVLSMKLKRCAINYNYINGLIYSQISKCTTDIFTFVF